MLSRGGLPLALLIVGCLLVTAAGCGPSRSASQPPLAPGVPHCAAAESAAAREQQYQQSNPTAPPPSVSAHAVRPPSPTSGPPPPPPSAMPTAVPTIVTEGVLDLGAAQLSRFPSAQYVIRIGTLVDIHLSDEAAPPCWSDLTLSTTSPLSVVNQGDDVGGGAHANFRAIAPGEITIATTNACYTHSHHAVRRSQLRRQSLPSEHRGHAGRGDVTADLPATRPGPDGQTSPRDLARERG